MLSLSLSLSVAWLICFDRQLVIADALLRRNDLDGIVLDAFTRFILTLFTLAVGLGLGLSAWVFAPHNMAKALGMITFILTVGVW